MITFQPELIESTTYATAYDSESGRPFATIERRRSGWIAHKLDGSKINAFSLDPTALTARLADYLDTLDLSPDARMLALDLLDAMETKAGMDNVVSREITVQENGLTYTAQLRFSRDKAGRPVWTFGKRISCERAFSLMLSAVSLKLEKEGKPDVPAPVCLIVPTAEEASIVRKAATEWAKAANEPGPYRVEVGERYADDVWAGSINVLQVDKTRDWEESDLRDVHPWSDFLKGVPTDDGRAIVDFYVYGRDGLACNIQAKFYKGRLVWCGECGSWGFTAFGPESLQERQAADEAWPIESKGEELPLPIDQATAHDDTAETATEARTDDSAESGPTLPRRVETIDVTPTWLSLVSTFVALIEAGNAEGRRTAIEEMARCAKIADIHVASHLALTKQLAAVRECLATVAEMHAADPAYVTRDDMAATIMEAFELAKESGK